MGKKLKIFQAIKNRLFGHFPQISYSRSGEDLIITELLGNKMTGFFIDVGAFHPRDYSNTYKFYLNGWTGINIDANQDIITKFDKERPRDINICAGVALEEEDKIFYKFNDDLSMSSFSTAFVENAIATSSLTLNDKIIIKTKKLGQILESCNITKQIDFMSVDVEGLDLDVLKSNNWEKFRPKVIVIEINCGFINIQASEIYKYTAALGYEPVAYTYLNDQVGNLIMLDRE
ncbi:FkbM family methyltransferase [Pedobacter mucosus]|uniref:FkbM family methyltransferase n=1 Tax=Pedobacter mucosus TaxID=2895286 RepID=UPI001EE416A3|nr:FkbM family methyltransferase [Pedobacter mucosus]UKT64402.1 FkbM family methyltransferase [Pedobacter mucosus]